MPLNKINKNFLFIFYKLAKRNSSKINKLIDRINLLERNFDLKKNLEEQNFEFNSNEQFLFEKNLKLSHELIEAKKKLEILTTELNKFKDEKNQIISKINSINNDLENSNVIKEVFKNKQEINSDIIEKKKLK